MRPRLGVALLGLALWAGGAGASSRELSLSARSDAWTYESYLGRHHVREILLPADARWSAARWFSVGAGADFMRLDARGPGQDGEYQGIRSIRGSLDLVSIGSRLLLHLGGESGFSSDRPARATVDAEVLAEDLALDLPGLPVVQGTRLGGGLGVQLIRARGLVVQAGLAYERRGAYDLTPDGLGLDPADPVRVAATVRRRSGRLDAGLETRFQRSGTQTLDGAGSWTTGREVGAALDASWAMDWGRVPLRLAVLVREGGAVSPGSVLDAHAVRGGNRVAWDLTLERNRGRWTLAAGAEGSHLRGFAGHLGHSDWVAPRAALLHRRAGREVGLSLRLPLGEARGGRPLHGFGLAVSLRIGGRS